MTGEQIVRYLMPVALGVIMFSMGLGLRVNDFRRIFLQPRAVAVGAVSQLVLLPMVGFLIAEAFDLPSALAVGVVLITACPGGPTSNLLSYLARGDVALSVTLTAVSGFATVVTIPLLVNWAGTTFAAAGVEPIALPILPTILQVAGVAIVPVIVGMLVRARRPSSADRLEATTKRLSFGILGLLIVGAVAKEHALVVDSFGRIGAAVLTLNVATTSLGFGVARLFRLPPRQAVTIAIEVGIQNAAFAISIAAGLLGDMAIALPAVVYGLGMYGVTGALVVLARRVLADEPAPALATGVRKT
jgi:BASS family bile acid:Na+ symporter